MLQGGKFLSHPREQVGVQFRHGKSLPLGDAGEDLPPGVQDQRLPPGDPAWGVDPELIEAHGILSQEVAEAMASAARTTLGTEVGLAVCAAPRASTFSGKPAGQIFMAVDMRGAIKSAELNYRSNPSEIKRLGSVFGLNLLRRSLLK